MNGTAAALSVVLALAACGAACSPAPAVPLIVPIAHESWGDYLVRVYDDSGLVLGARPSGQRGVRDFAAFPDERRLEINWMGGACSHGPTVSISGTAERLDVVVDNPADPQWLPFLPVTCPAVGVPLGVNISLSEPVQQDAVGLSVNY